jgi:hypothetical protein
MKQRSIIKKNILKKMIKRDTIASRVSKDELSEITSMVQKKFTDYLININKNVMSPNNILKAKHIL